MVKLIKLPFKLLALPLILILMTAVMTAVILVRMVTNLSSYIVGPLMLFILVCGIYSTVQQRWTSVAILAVSEVLCVAVLFFAFSVMSALEGMRDFLVSFVHS